MAPAPSPNSPKHPTKHTPTVPHVLQRLDAHGHLQLVQRDRPLRLAVQVVESVPQSQGLGQEFAAAGVFGRPVSSWGMGRLTQRDLLRQPCSGWPIMISCDIFNQLKTLPKFPR